MMTDYLKITTKELMALIETADTCEALINCEDTAREAVSAVKAYKAVLKRNKLSLTERKSQQFKV